jgi:NNMT/PNMT/TEMT family
MSDLLPSSDALDPQKFPAGRSRLLTLRSMIKPSAGLRPDRVRKNTDPDWKAFPSDEYWRRNYQSIQPEDREIIDRVNLFFRKAYSGRARAQRAIDVGSGTNLYPALLMLPWTDQILLSDQSASNVRWLRHHVMDDGAPWTWQPFWQEVCDLEGYSQISDPRERLRQACTGHPGQAGFEQRTVFGLPPAQWQLGTMFFVAESITEEPEEFRAAIDGFVGALQPHSPFAATFMAGSDGYDVADISFPALPITTDHVTEHFKRLGVSELSVDLLQTDHRVREGYEGMIVATGIVGS